MSQLSPQDQPRSDNDSALVEHELTRRRTEERRRTLVFRLVFGLVLAQTVLSTGLVFIALFSEHDLDRYVLIAFLGGSVAQSYLLMSAIAKSLYPQSRVVPARPMGEDHESN